MPRLEALATAVPDTRLEQSEVREALAALLADSPSLHRVLDAFDRAGIATRYVAKPTNWYLDPQGWRSRSEAYVEEGMKVSVAAATAAIEKAGVPAAAVDGIVFVSTTGVATPSLDARLQNALGCRRDVLRVPLWGYGCAGGVAGLNRTADLARAHPDKRFLLVTLELCSLNFRLQARSKKHLIANALFADGAAAALVTGDALAGTGPRIGRGMSHTWPGTEHLMGWIVEDDGLDVVFDASIPDVVRDHIAPVTHRFLKEATNGQPPTRHVLHPGGAKILEAYADAMGLDAAALQVSYDTLRDYGNLSSPTVLFALERSLRTPLRTGETALLAAMGPGFAAEFGLLEGTDS
ncbi:MAG TPA: 3-oxoacyl-[acyl-carrier-protein] synthase III C-terminal domain-containing protein [Candidatus Thermoplasmatota archaeon]|nr:3-oxoacyl-[acyl-carrier-protein] synthase III C-terminal domain-containing protein [Candidatus Thermoplasmatota archaeon]